MSSTAKTPLDPDEERVVRAQRLLIGLGAALVYRPFNAATYDALRDYLDRDAPGVLASLEVLSQRPEAELRARINELAGGWL
ncbi:hypothetical protein [Streptomyces violaceusniger]|uniref:Uncharacterized protein n=1 Tax=Streptomyces violaceusniger (strain Tu 4113) TaxID=653045 RepID=G2PH87_STRV4|nr:hypothetical protein [Streptomyces violaceusniger]AEM88733.1 hypothetical protein Strvi_9482 [Streptomyces violaceusniger Tu 4113]